MDNKFTLQDQTYTNIRNKVIDAKNKVYSVVNFTMVEAYWEIGEEIFIAQNQNNRAEYGKGLLKFLSKTLTDEFGKGFEESNLRNMRQFYITFQNRDTLCHKLSWSHYRLIMRIENEERREFYLKESADSNWSVRQLERQINSFYYERLLATNSEDKSLVKNEIQKLEPKIDPNYILKDPYILEFFKLAKEIRNSLGNQGYLLDSYLSMILGSMNNKLAHDAANEGFEPFSDLFGICSSIQGEHSRDMTKHPFYETAKKFIEDHPLSYQEKSTVRDLYCTALSNDFISFAVKKFIEKVDVVPSKSQKTY